MSGKKLATGGLSELYKRCPPNQLKQFLEFRDKTMEYQRRVNKHPEFLPKIDWEYYRRNVRSEYVKMIDEFQQKYDELNKSFNSRQEDDTSKYYTEFEKLQEQVRLDLEVYLAESNIRIQGYEAEIERIRKLIPYEEMNMEEFYEQHPDPPFTYKGQPTFWPHFPEEQKPGPAGTQLETNDEPKRKKADATEAQMKAAATIAEKPKLAEQGKKKEDKKESVKPSGKKAEKISEKDKDKEKK